MSVHDVVELFVGNVVGAQRDIFGNGLRSVIFVLQEQKRGPLGVFPPEGKNGFGAFESAASGEMEDRFFLAGDGSVMEIFRGEAREVAGGMMFGKDFEGVPAFAKDMVDLLKKTEVSPGKTFLVWNDDVGGSVSQPPRENSLHKDIEIEAGFPGKPAMPKGDFAAMTAGYGVSGIFEGFGDQVDIAIQPDPIGSSDEINLQRRSRHGRRRVTMRGELGNRNFERSRTKCLASCWSWLCTWECLLRRQIGSGTGKSFIRMIRTAGSW